MGKDLNGQEPERARASVGKSLNERWAKASVGKNFYGQRGSVGTGLNWQRPTWAKALLGFLENHETRDPQF